MTGDLSVARRYASALFAVAKKKGEVGAVALNLGEVSDTVRSSRELMSVLHRPMLPLERKQAVVRGVFGGKVRPDVEKFLFLVVEKNRATILPEIVEQFNVLFDEFRGQADATVETAVPLSPQQLANLQASLK